MSRRGSRVQFSFFPPKTVCRCPSASQQGSGKHFKISLLPIGCRAATGQQPFRWISGKQNNPQFWVISSAARAVSLHLNGRWFESAMTQKISVAAHWPPRRGGQGQKRFKNFHCLPLAANCLLPKGQSLVTATSFVFAPGTKSALWAATFGEDLAAKQKPPLRTKAASALWAATCGLSLQIWRIELKSDYIPPIIKILVLYI